jgi:YbgC/YbaW family acyl-CoA thioester hydrolase
MFQNVIERQIGWGDLDPAGIVYYPRYYEWIDAAGHLFFDAIALNMKDLGLKRQIQFSLAETGCRYLKPGRYLEKIRIITDIEDLGKKVVTLRHRIVGADDGVTLAEGLEKRICVDISNPERLRAKDIPEDILIILQEKKGV